MEQEPGCKLAVSILAHFESGGRFRTSAVVWSDPLELVASGLTAPRKGRPGRIGLLALGGLEPVGAVRAGAGRLGRVRPVSVLGIPWVGYFRRGRVGLRGSTSRPITGCRGPRFKHHRWLTLSGLIMLSKRVRIWLGLLDCAIIVALLGLTATAGVPPARFPLKFRIVEGVILLCFALSLLSRVTDQLPPIRFRIRTIMILVAVVAAQLRAVKCDDSNVWASRVGSPRSFCSIRDCCHCSRVYSEARASPLNGPICYEKNFPDLHGRPLFHRIVWAANSGTLKRV